VKKAEEEEDDDTPWRPNFRKYPFLSLAKNQHMWAAWAAARGIAYDASVEEEWSDDLTISEQQRLLAARRKKVLAAVREALEDAIEEVDKEDKPPIVAGQNSKSSSHRMGQI